MTDLILLFSGRAHVVRFGAVLRKKVFKNRIIWQQVTRLDVRMR